MARTPKTPASVQTASITDALMASLIPQISALVAREVAGWKSSAPAAVAASPKGKAKAKAKASAKDAKAERFVGWLNARQTEGTPEYAQRQRNKALAAAMKAAGVKPEGDAWKHAKAHGFGDVK